jgi:CBS domain containing-hemolysin-like protein
MVAAGLVLTVGTGFFVASEFALVNLDRNDLEGRERAGEARLGPTIRALRITSTHLSGAQLGITLTTLLTGFTFEPAVSRLLEGPLAAVGVAAGAVPVVGAVVGIGLATLLSMVIGELVPKNFAIALPLATAKVVVPFQTVFTAVFKPLILLCNNTARSAAPRHLPDRHRPRRVRRHGRHCDPRGPGGGDRRRAARRARPNPPWSSPLRPVSGLRCHLAT